MKERLEKVAHLFQKYDSPISVAVRMAQFALESKAGQSELFKKSNNGFGIKASPPWTGDKVLHNSMEVGGAEDSYFRKYPSLEASIKDHASFFTSTSHRAQVAYKDAIEATNYKDEAHALTRIYAGDKQYGQKLIEIIEDYNLTQYNKEEIFMAFPKPAMIDRRTRALGYPGHGVYAKRNKSAIKNVVWHYTLTTHMGDGEQVIKNHEKYWKNTHGWDIGGYHFYISRNNPKIYWNYDLEKVTYGAGSVNPTTMHISVEASSASNYTAEQIKLREQLTLWLLTNDLKHLSGKDVKGHNYFMNTKCPGYSIDQMNTFGAELDKKIKANKGTTSGGSAPTKPAANEVTWPEYRKPTQPFDELKVGDKVTIRKGQSAWYIPTTPKIGKKPSKDFAGDKDTITKVMDVNISYSKKAYLLKGKVSWILEQDLEEARKSWVEKSSDIKTHTVKSGEYLHLIGEKYGITVANIKDWNSLSSNVIFSGQKLFVEDPAKKSQKPVETVPEDVIEAPAPEQPKDEGDKTPAVELKDGEFMWNGVKYKIVEEVI